MGLAATTVIIMLLGPLALLLLSISDPGVFSFLVPTIGNNVAWPVVGKALFFVVDHCTSDFSFIAAAA